MKPDFSTMNRKQLRAYLLTHRDDREAFYAYIDRSEAEAEWVEMPFVQSLEELKHLPEFEHLQGNRPNKHSDSSQQ